MATIVTRSGKGSPLTHAEVDSNFTNLNTDKLELSGGTMTGNLSFGDNDKAIFGAGSDLQIYHDGDHSYIKETATGNLRIVGGDRIQFYNNDQTELFAQFINQAQVELRYDNSTKFATTSTGVDITGTLTSDGLTVDGTTNLQGTNPDLYFIEGDTTDLNAYIANGSGNFTTYTANDAKSVFKQRINLDHSTGDISFYEDTGTTAKFFWDASAERLGIGTTSPSALVDISKSGTGDYSTLKLSNTGASGRKYELGVGGSGTGNYAGKFYVYDSTAGQPRFSLDSSGNVGIGTISPDNSLHISYTDSTAYSDATHDAGIQIENTDTTTNSFSQLHFRTGNSDSYIRNIREGDNLASLAFLTDDGGVTGDVGEAMRIDSSGNLLVGKTSVNSGVVGVEAKADGTLTATVDGDTVSLLNRKTNDGEILRLQKDSTTVGSIATETGDLIIHSTAASHAGLRFGNTRLQPADNTGTTVDDAIDIGITTSRFKDLYLSGGLRGEPTFKNNAGTTEYARFDSSGNLLVGQTTASSTDVGVSARSNGVLIATADGSNSALFNRKTSDGDIVQFRKDGSTVGSIGVFSSDNLGITGSAASHAGVIFGTNQVLPASSGTYADAAVDVGNTTTRFKDLYLSGGVIQSDGGESVFGGGSPIDSLVAVSIQGASNADAAEVKVRTNGKNAFKFRNSSNSDVGSITVNASSTAYNTSSDYRLKTDTQPMTGATDRLKQLNPVNFEWIADGTRVDGFLAHEAQEVVPEAVTGTKDAMRDEEYEVTPAVLDDDGNVVTEAVMGTRSVPDYQGIDQSKLVPLLTAALQEALTEIADLKARVTTLEG